MKTIGVMIGVMATLATFHHARTGDVAQTIFGCVGLLILYDSLKGR